jgi:molybdopterin/thiamine biosynthesis adenylyltransferase
MNFTRQFDIISPEMLDRYSVTLIGAGGIGAAAGLALAKLGVQFMEIYDFDEVDDVNIPTQLHRVSDIGMNKGEALAKLMKEFSDEIRGTVYRRVFKDDTFVGNPMVVSAVDSIAARKGIWEAVYASVGAEWYIDARMGAETFQMYTVHLEEEETVEPYHLMLRNLHDDDVPDAPCTARATIYTAFIAAGHIAHQVKRIAMQQLVPSVLIHDISSMQLLTPGKDI